MPFDVKTYSQIGVVNLVNYLLGGRYRLYPSGRLLVYVPLDRHLLDFTGFKLVYDHDQRSNI